MPQNIYKKFEFMHRKRRKSTLCSLDAVQVHFREFLLIEYAICIHT